MGKSNFNFDPPPLERCFHVSTAVVLLAAGSCGLKTRVLGQITFDYKAYAFGHAI